MSVSACLTEDERNTFLAGGGSPEAREMVELHLSQCKPCRQRLVEQFAIAKIATAELDAPAQLKARALALAGNKPASPQRFAIGLRQGLAIAASLILVVSLTLVFVLRRATQPLPANEVLRQEEGMLSSPHLLSPASESIVSSEAIEFQWSMVEGADSYWFTLLNEKGDVLLQSTTRTERLLVKATEVRLENAKPYFWYVAAKSGFGVTVESKINKFTLANRREN